MQHYHRNALTSELNCPYHPEQKMFVNGCGGKGMKIVNKALSLLPSSDLFYGACSLHDVVYALVSLDPIQVTTQDGKTWTLRDREDCDNIWLSEMLDITSTLNWGWQRSLMRWAARRNYNIVRANGDSWFKHEH